MESFRVSPSVLFWGALLLAIGGSATNDAYTCIRELSTDNLLVAAVFNVVLALMCLAGSAILFNNFSAQSFVIWSALSPALNHSIEQQRVADQFGPRQPPPQTRKEALL
jgi:hypothetical protein